MSALRMRQAMDSLAMDHNSNAHASPYSNVHEWVFYVVIAQLELGECARVYICVYFYAVILEPASKLGQDLLVLPEFFGGCRYGTVLWGGFVKA